MTPTLDQYLAFQKLFSYYNKNLFNGELPGVFLNFSGKTGAAGFFAPNRWRYIDGEKAHEISINPISLVYDKKYLVETLVHEMCHLWQQEYGKPSRRSYHNKEWAMKMESVGLIPSATGRPGGRKTGQAMSDYMIEGGLLENLMNEMPEDHWLPLTSIEFGAVRVGNNNSNTVSPFPEEDQGEVDPAPVETTNEQKKKTKYSCPIWALLPEPPKR